MANRWIRAACCCFLVLYAWGAALETAAAELEFSEEQYALLMRCSANNEAEEWNAWVRKNTDTEGKPLVKIRLQGADFRSANLRGARLAHADLRGANFYAADLTSADLRAAQLQGANFTGAVLIDVRLDDATSTGAQWYNATWRQPQTTRPACVSITF